MSQREVMSATLELLEQYKHALGMRADCAAASALGVKNQTVSNWHTRGSQAEPWLIEKMCAAIGVPTAPWLLRVQFEQTPNASNKQVWQRVAEHLGFKLAGLAGIAGLPGVGLLLKGGAGGIGADITRARALLAMLAGWF